MSDIALVRVTCAGGEEAERIAAAVIGERLAACANLSAPCTSIYRWQGAVERDEEVAVLFKTTLPLVGKLRARIATLHSYDLPVIEAWPVSVDATVADWVAAETA